MTYRLGRGGNGTVWAASRGEAGETVALKLINTTKADREPYQRFVREISFLREHGDVDGVLPLLDAHLPDEPSKRDQPWLAMPIATPIADALGGQPLAVVVNAIAAVAETLRRLEHDHGIAHRDIKPGNLYELDGRWLIGDFGLIALPDADTLTVQGRPMGPAHFTAYELIRDPATADAHPADVYSVAKTLWVLATDQHYPPEGHQPVGSRGFVVGDFRPHPRSGSLDQEIDLMTRLHPEQRPTKEQVARDLAAWESLSTEDVALDVSEARLVLRQKLAPTLDLQATRNQQKESAMAAVRRLQQLTRPLNEALKTLYDGAAIDSQSDKMTVNVLKSHGGMGDPRVHFRWQRCSIVRPGDRPGSVALRLGRSIELRGEGDLVLHLMVDVGPEGIMGSSFHWNPPETVAPVGTIEAERMVDKAAEELAAALQRGIDALLEAL